MDPERQEFYDQMERESQARRARNLKIPLKEGFFRCAICNYPLPIPRDVTARVECPKCKTGNGYLP